MSAFRLFLKVLACVIFCVAMIHVLLGLTGEALLLGADLSGLGKGAANLDSQNRFYGMVFAVFSVILWCESERPFGYDPIFRLAVAIFFAGGLVRFLSWAIWGWPTWQIVGLLALELILPPIVLIWHARLKRENA